MNANDLITLGLQIMGWFVAVLIFVFSVALMLTGIVITVQVGLIVWRNVRDGKY